MKPFIAVMIFAALQEIVNTSLSRKEHSELRSGDENEELLSRAENSREFCEGSSDQCKVRNTQVSFHHDAKRISVG